MNIVKNPHAENHSKCLRNFVQNNYKHLIFTGCSGETVILRSNYFKLMSMADWCLYQYRVDFDPPEERTVIRKGLLKLHKNKLGAYIFDGTVLYTAVRLHQSEADVSNVPFVLSVTQYIENIGWSKF